MGSEPDGRSVRRLEPRLTMELQRAKRSLQLTTIMTPIRIPALTVSGLAGATGSVTLTVQLVSAAGRPLVGVLTSDGGPVTCYVVAVIASPPVSDDPPSPLELLLTPQSMIVAPDAGGTYYRFTFTADRRQVAEWQVKVPDAEDGRTLADLIAGVQVDPVDILAGRLLTLRERAALSAAHNPSAANPIATRADVGPGGGGGGGHVIRDGTGQALPQQAALRFIGVVLTDDAADGETCVTVAPAPVQRLTAGTGILITALGAGVYRIERDTTSIIDGGNA